jgi:hypothetical protein
MIDAAEKLRECSEKAGSTEGESHWESELKKLSAE